MEYGSRKASSDVLKPRYIYILILWFIVVQLVGWSVTCGRDGRKFSSRLGTWEVPIYIMARRMGVLIQADAFAILSRQCKIPH
jgi:hypothetical protein